MDVAKYLLKIALIKEIISYDLFYMFIQLMCSCIHCKILNIKEHITKKALCYLRKISKFSIKQITGWGYKLATEPRSLNRACFIKSKI